MAELHRIPLKRIDGTDDTLAAHAGKVLLVVNVVSKCGLTPQPPLSKRCTGTSAS